MMRIEIIYSIGFKFASGIQLKPINFSKKLLIWNILIIIIINCYYKILVSQLYWDNNVMKNSSKINKNLNNFMSLIGGYYLQISIIINPIIFLSIGSSINHLMSDKIFTRIYNSRQKSWNVIGKYSIIILTDFIEFTIFSILFEWNEKHCKWEIFIEIFTNYFLCLMFFLPFFILNYIKFATFEWFDQISIDNDKNIESIIKQINHMAIINRKISRNLSPILSIVIISSIIDIIVLFMWFQNYDLNFLRSFISSLTTWLYLGYLIQLDSNSIRKFQFIIEKFINENLFKCCKHNNNNDNNCCCCCCSKQQQKNNIIFCQQKQRLIECYRLYRHDFQMNLFKLCSIDCNFLLQSFLFILIFVVISLQT
ncbi:uncharacterized protein LOC142645264 isoform X2 [Dermatophagoides pteronyssinus]|uniref:uncharacterized protein LOC142645264 isoform X2 n=1 Tax=Dermatophagoides pteronyssinus TaxID=6956 RepID=UPI003F663C9B